jgi:hypothetical protein
MPLFAKLFDFGFQRTTVQAIGWYIVFFALWLPIGGVVGYVAATSATDGTSGDFDAGFAQGYAAGAEMGAKAAIVYVALLAILLLLKRRLDVVNALLAAAAIAGSVVLGALLGLAPLAVLTTRPASEPRLPPHP